MGSDRCRVYRQRTPSNLQLWRHPQTKTCRRRCFSKLGSQQLLADGIGTGKRTTVHATGREGSHVPTGHSPSQNPGERVNRPAGQEMQAVAGLKSLSKVPAPQTAQVLAPPAACVPNGQAEHCAAFSSAANMPAWQSSHRPFRSTLLPGLHRDEQHPSVISAAVSAATAARKDVPFAHSCVPPHVAQLISQQSASASTGSKPVTSVPRSDSLTARPLTQLTLFPQVRIRPVTSHRQQVI